MESYFRNKQVSMQTLACRIPCLFLNSWQQSNNFIKLQDINLPGKIFNIEKNSYIWVEKYSFQFDAALYLKIKYQNSYINTKGYHRHRIGLLGKESMTKCFLRWKIVGVVKTVFVRLNFVVMRCNEDIIRWKITLPWGEPSLNKNFKKKTSS